MRKRLIHLHHCRGISWKTIYQLLQIDPTLESFFTKSPDTYVHKLAPTIKTTFMEDLQSRSIQKQIQAYSLHNIHVITIFDKEYPPLLREIYEPPWVLYGKGNRDLLTKNRLLAVVGSRTATMYGKSAIKAIVPRLSDNGIAIVSGLAEGIDTYAHKAAIKAGGKTIAVIAGGLFHIYPKVNKELALYMMANHLVISEYPPQTKPSRWQFPVRNRIISGISHGTFVVEAKAKSGSLITANFAVQEGREVFALPGSIFSPHSIGTNELIQQGAKLVNTEEDILNEFLY